jgi:hypothetical protein
MVINKKHIDLTLPPHFSYNSDLRNFRKIQVVSNNIIDQFLENFSQDLEIQGLMFNQIFTYSSNIVFKEFINTNEINFIDNINKKSDSISGFNSIVFSILSHSNRKFMTSSREICSRLTEDHRFIYKKMNSLSGSFQLFRSEELGSLGQTKVLIDYNFQDNFIFLFDKIEVSYEIESISFIDEPEIIPRGQLNALFDFNIVNPKLYYIIDSKNSEFYSEFLSQDRDKMIDRILN